MTLKDKILEESYKAKCVNCNNFEILTKNEIPYCNATNKMLLPFQCECVRKCANFINKEE